MRVTGSARRAPASWGPPLLVLALTVLLTAQIFDPALQLFDRDVGRAEYSFKQFMALRLRAFELPLWFPWTGAGTSLLAEITPALFHPATLLYLVLPFELAFKLNHVLPIPLAAAGAFLLVRKLSASTWPAALAGAVYGGSGYLASMSASNLHYALGAATVPLAVHALLRFLEAPRPLRLLWAGFALALPLLGGEPQSALFAGYGGVLAALCLHGCRSLRLAALWGATALLLCAPSLLPAAVQLARSARHEGVSEYERQVFAMRAPRLAGSPPWAFDDAPERTLPDGPLPAFAEYFAGPRAPRSSPPSRSRSRRCCSRHLPAAEGPCCCGSWRPLSRSDRSAARSRRPCATCFPGLWLFRYPEKLIGPLTLLLALLAGLGADRAFKTPRAAGWLAAAAF